MLRLPDIVYYILLITECLVVGLRDVRVAVPKAARRGDTVVLYCHFDLEGDPLYAVQWYKGHEEFYRYTPKEKPPMKLFPIPGLSDLRVDKPKSNESQVMLQAVTPTLSGQYNCEVSADAPSFHTAVVASYMDIVEVPKQPPNLTVTRPRYRLRDTLKATCTAAPSKPAVNLTWGLNGENVNPKWVKQYRQVPEKFVDLEQSMSVLEIPLKTYHFVNEGKLKVRCTASLYDLYWHTTEVSVEKEEDTLTAADSSANDWDTDDFDGEYGTYSNVIVGAFPSMSSPDVASSSPHLLPSILAVCSLLTKPLLKLPNL